MRLASLKVSQSCLSWVQLVKKYSLLKRETASRKNELGPVDHFSDFLDKYHLFSIKT